ncbi:MAG: hypothetical protein U9Q83_02790 [Bacteroidota bacterium]|nr:hypothetical protein [Bacteroidota bacterium]
MKVILFPASEKLFSIRKRIIAVSFFVSAYFSTSSEYAVISDR